MGCHFLLGPKVSSTQPRLPQNFLREISQKKNPLEGIPLKKKKPSRGILKISREKKPSRGILKTPEEKILSREF
jgi:hypothetical protein